MEEKKLTAWDRMELIRHKGRPTVRDYIPMIFDEFYEMHGDRLFGDDAAIVGGIARVHGIPVTVLGQVKGRNLEENKKTNFSIAPSRRLPQGPAAGPPGREVPPAGDLLYRHPRRFLRHCG